MEHDFYHSCCCHYDHLELIPGLARMDHIVLILHPCGVDCPHNQQLIELISGLGVLDDILFVIQLYTSGVDCPNHIQLIKFIKLNLLARVDHFQLFAISSCPYIEDDDSC